MNICDPITTTFETPSNNTSEKAVKYIRFLADDSNEEDEENMEFDVVYSRHDPNTLIETEATELDQEEVTVLVEEELVRQDNASKSKNKTKEKRPTKSVVMNALSDFTPLEHDKPESSALILSLPVVVDVNTPASFFSLFFQMRFWM